MLAMLSPRGDFVHPRGAAHAYRLGSEASESRILAPGDLIPSTQMKLPNGDRAIVEIAKLRDYCLDPQHHQGKHKARVFAATLGMTQTDAPALRKELLRAAREVDAARGESDGYGERFTIDFETSRSNRPAVVRSAWIVLRGESAPRLTSCFVL